MSCISKGESGVGSLLKTEVTMSSFLCLAAGCCFLTVMIGGLFPPGMWSNSTLNHLSQKTSAALLSRAWNLKAFCWPHLISDVATLFLAAVNREVPAVTSLTWVLSELQHTWKFQAQESSAAEVFWLKWSVLNDSVLNNSVVCKLEKFGAKWVEQERLHTALWSASSEAA